MERSHGLRVMSRNHMMDYRHIITSETGKRSGKLIIRGTRMTVIDVLEYSPAGKMKCAFIAGG